jgi:hypothetical protein
MDNIRMFFLKLEYRIKYYYGSFMELFGYCHKCGTKMSRTGVGRLICTNIDCKK